MTRALERVGALIALALLLAVLLGIVWVLGWLLLAIGDLA